jgi:hypothetical protein
VNDWQRATLEYALLLLPIVLGVLFGAAIAHWTS